MGKRHKNKLRHLRRNPSSKARPKAKDVPSSSSSPPDVGPPGVRQAAGRRSVPTNDGDGASADELVSKLREEVEQGRIFDALSAVDDLKGLERRDPSISQKLEPVRHLMDEVVSQSEHATSLLHELHSDDDWVLAKQRSGVTVHYRREADSPIHTVRAATTFHDFSPKDFVRLCSLFVETELMHEWFPAGVMRPATLLSWHSKYSKVIQLRVKLGLPMISARDAIVLGSGYHLPDRNAFMIFTKTMLDDTCRYCEIPKPDKGVVRMHTESIFYVQMLKSDVVSFKMIGRDDLKLKYMPSALLNYLAQGHLPFDMMKTIHRKIRNFKGTAWEDKIRERGAYYTEIEDKVYAQLDIWEKGGGDVGSGVQLEGDETRDKGPNIRATSKDVSSGKVERTKVKRDEAEDMAFDPTAFVADDDDGEGRSRLAIAAAVSVLLGLALHFAPSPGVFPTYAIFIVDSLSGVHLTENTAVAVMIVPVAVVLAWAVRKKRQNKDDTVTAKEQSTASDDMKEHTTEDAGYDEFVRFVNTDTKSDAAEAVAENAGSDKAKAVDEAGKATSELAGPDKAVGNSMDDFLQYINSNPSKERAPAEAPALDPIEEPKSPNGHVHNENIGGISEMSTQSTPTAKEAQCFKPTSKPLPTQASKLHTSQSTRLKKKEKRRTPVKGLRRAVSLHFSKRALATKREDTF